MQATPETPVTMKQAAEPVQEDTRQAAIDLCCRLLAVFSAHSNTVKKSSELPIDQPEYLGPNSSCRSQNKAEFTKCRANNTCFGCTTSSMEEVKH
jgi:hypothetical protein